MDIDRYDVVVGSGLDGNPEVRISWSPTGDFVYYDDFEVAIKERDEALAKLAAMESQEPAIVVKGNKVVGYNHKGGRREGEFYAMPIRATASHQGWYCAHCQCGVDPSEVTYNEAHTACGRIITDDEPPAPADKPAVAVPDVFQIMHQMAQEFKEGWPEHTGKYDWMIGYAERFKRAPSHSQQSAKDVFTELMRDICEHEEGHESERSVMLNYDWLYSRIESVMCPGHESEQGE